MADPFRPRFLTPSILRDIGRPGLFRVLEPYLEWFAAHGLKIRHEQEFSTPSRKRGGVSVYGWGVWDGSAGERRQPSRSLSRKEKASLKLLQRLTSCCRRIGLNATGFACTSTPMPPFAFTRRSA